MNRILIFLGVSMALVAVAAIALMESNEAEPRMTVYKSPTCGCCENWLEIVDARGMGARGVNTEDMDAVKQQFGVPKNMEGCHTAIVDGYFVEGHVPFEAIERLLQERPEIDGIAVPGMPAGSPGMSGYLEGPLTVYAIVDGEASPYMTFKA